MLKLNWEGGEKNPNPNKATINPLPIIQISNPGEEE